MGERIRFRLPRGTAGYRPMMARRTTDGPGEPFVIRDQLGACQMQYAMVRNCVVVLYEMDVVPPG